MTLDQIKTVQAQIQQVISRKVDINNPTDCMHKLEQISTLLASGSTCIAHSKNILLKARKEALDRIYLAKEGDKELKKVLSPSIVNKFLETRTIDEETLFTECERNYSAIVHSGDFLRSILSCIKEEMRISATM